MNNPSERATPAEPQMYASVLPALDPLNLEQRRRARVGVAYALAAYGAWALVAVYFRAIREVPPLEVLAHRAVWSALLLALILLAQRRWRDVAAALRNRRTLAWLGGSTLLIAGNWLTFFLAVAHEQVLQASLGYFINPLVNVLLGFVFLGERLTRPQGFSVLLAAAGVAYLTVSYGQLPVIALILALSFGFYGLLRKTAAVEGLTGLLVETLLLSPLALAYLGYVMWRGESVFGAVSWRMDLLLALGGVVTAVPLLWFANAARRLRLATLGFLQYIAPTGQFFLAVLAFGEPFSRTQMVSFTLIWIALAIYSLDTARRLRKLPANMSTLRPTSAD